jgi:mRNA interferase MazF
VKRGEIWTIAGGADHSGKPRPAVLVQNDRFVETASVIVCPFTTNPAHAPVFRILVAPSATNGLDHASKLMADKVTTIDRRKLGRRLGRLEEDDLDRLERAILLFMGLVK